MSMEKREHIGRIGSRYFEMADYVTLDLTEIVARCQAVS